MGTYIHTYIHTYIQTRIYTHTLTYIHTHTHTHTYDHIGFVQYLISDIICIPSLTYHNYNHNHHNHYNYISSSWIIKQITYIAFIFKSVLLAYLYILILFQR